MNWPGHFSNRNAFSRMSRICISHHRAWRGELLLRSEGNREKPLMVRADPVQPSRDRVLGFVLIFSDITDRKAAEIARSRFQEGIIQSNRINSVRLDSKTDLVYQNLLSSVIENAQLAALEITYGVETSRIAEMLESVRNSTLRTAEVLEHLIWHSSRTSGGEQAGEIAASCSRRLIVPRLPRSGPATSWPLRRTTDRC